MTGRRLDVNGIGLHVIDEGAGEPVVLLHGFPDSSYLWRHQIAALTSRGFRAIAPDLRGFGESDKPEDVSSYKVANVVVDVLGMMDALEVQRAHVVGHDWGAAVAWTIASFVPERVSRLVAVSVGHPMAFRPLSIEQREKWWYMLFFQFEGVAEAWLQADGWKLAREFLRGEGDAARYMADLSRPGALTAALNWYRANAKPRVPGREIEFPSVKAPTLGVWSSGDRFVLEDPMRRSGEFVDGEFRYERIEGASHWMQVDEPDRLNNLLLDFLGA